MNAYIYQAALWCEDCAREIRERLTAEGKAPEDPSDETSFDSDAFPKGPFPDGGGEADTPQHCDGGETCCNAESLFDGTKVGAFLENDLTDEGMEYVREAVRDASSKTGCRAGASVALELWGPFYDVHSDDESEANNG